MGIWKRIRQLSLGQLFRFGLLFLKNPLLIAPTIRASKRTIEICDLHFGWLHHSNRKENAFRHALWNWEICEKCQKRVKNDEKTVIWVEKVTNMYEKVTKNESLEEAMDLHNNGVGRKLFLTVSLSKWAKKDEFLLKMMQKAVKIDKLEELIGLENKLVYISE